MIISGTNFSSKRLGWKKHLTYKWVENLIRETSRKFNKEKLMREESRKLNKENLIREASRKLNRNNFEFYPTSLFQ